MRALTNSRRRFPLVMAVLAMPVLAGCGDDGGTGPGPGPGPGGDASLPETAAAVEETIDEFLVENEAVVSIAGLSPAMTAGCGASVLALVEVAHAVQTLGFGEASAAGREESIRDATDAAASLGAIPSQCMGETFALNPETGLYEPAGGGGAPSAGVRFVLYEVDASGQAVSPLTDIGHVDIVDNSTESTLSGSIEAVVGGATLIDFSGSLAVGETSATLNAGGFFSPDGSDRMDVSMNGSLSGSDTQADISASAELSAPGLLVTSSLDASANLNAETINGSVGSRLEHGGNRVDFAADFDETGDVSGDIELNGDLVATFSVNAETGAVQVTDASGGDLSQGDLASLEAMFDASADALEPIGEIAALLLVLSGGF